METQPEMRSALVRIGACDTLRFSSVAAGMGRVNGLISPRLNRRFAGGFGRIIVGKALEKAWHQGHERRRRMREATIAKKVAPPMAQKKSRLLLALP